MAKPRRGLAADDLFGDLIPGGPGRGPSSPRQQPPAETEVSEPATGGTGRSSSKAGETGKVSKPKTAKRKPGTATPSRKRSAKPKQPTQRPVASDLASEDPEPSRASARLSAMIAAEVLEAARDAVYITPGLTLAALVEEALRRELRRLERDRGESFPSRKGELPRGRRVR